MELKESTLSILKNFASINPNIVIAEGNTLKTITEAKNVLATATVEESFPKTVGIYDLSEFLGVLSLVDVPKLEFNDDFAIVSDSFPVITDQWVHYIFQWDGNKLSMFVNTT